MVWKVNILTRSPPPRGGRHLATGGPKTENQGVFYKPPLIKELEDLEKIPPGKVKAYQLHSSFFSYLVSFYLDGVVLMF